MLNRAILKFAITLNSSNRYKSIKKFFLNMLRNQEYQYKRYFDISMIILIVISITILVYEVKVKIPYWIDFFDIYIVTGIFLIEYILRLWVYNDWHSKVVKDYEESSSLRKPFNVWKSTRLVLKEKILYLLSPPALIDFLAILPVYRPIRVLRIFILFRVFKLLRYTKSIHQFVEVLSNKKFELLTLLFLLLFLVGTAGIAMYIIEEKYNHNIDSLFDSFYWALITISTVGYGDISPITTEGKIISMLVILSGIAMISFLTSIIVSAFSERLTELKENRMIDDINKSKEFVLIGGYGQMIRIFLKTYKDNNIPFNYLIIEKDINIVNKAIKDGYNVINDDASEYDILKQFNTKYNKIKFLVLTRSDIDNIYMILNAKSISRNIQVIARANNERMAKKCYLAGADQVLMPNIIANRMLVIAITKPAMYRAIYAILTNEHIAHLDELNIASYKGLIGRELKDINFKKYKLLLIGMESIIKKDFIFNPPLDSKLVSGDIILIMGQRVNIKYFIDSHIK